MFAPESFIVAQALGLPSTRRERTYSQLCLFFSYLQLHTFRSSDGCGGCMWKRVLSITFRRGLRISCFCSKHCRTIAAARRPALSPSRRGQHCWAPQAARRDQRSSQDLSRTCPGLVQDLFHDLLAFLLAICNRTRPRAQERASD